MFRLFLIVVHVCLLSFSMAFYAQAAGSEIDACLALPQKSKLTMMVPAPAGTSTDRTARIISEMLSKRIRAIGKDYSTVLINKGVVGGALAAQDVAQTPFPENVLMIAPSAVITVIPNIDFGRGKLYSAQAFSALAYVTSAHNVLVCNKNRENVPGVSSPEQFLADLQNRQAGKNEIFYATGGPSTFANLVMMDLLHQLGQSDKGIALAYRDAALITSDLVGGHIQCAFMSVSSVRGLYKKYSKQLAIVGTNAKQEITVVSDIKAKPFNVLKGVEKFGDIANWIGMFSSSRMPETHKACYQQELKRILNDPKFIAKMEEMGFTQPSELIIGDAFEDYISKTLPIWQPYVEIVNRQLN